MGVKFVDGCMECNEQFGFSISSFYNDTCLFITGATGFVGKTLVEKLLRSCSGIKKIYILIREKRGQTSEIRFKSFMNDPVFFRICPEDFSKMECIPGDVSRPYLGISDNYRQQLIEEVNIVFNCAATIKFNEPLFDATNLNALGTQRLMELCCKMMNLKSVVHVSTAYCYPEVDVCDEKIYSGNHFDKEDFFKRMAVMKPDIINSEAKKFTGKAPNTYVFTKSLAEQIIYDYKNEIPVSIIRPSIISGAINEPEPGYTDSIQGINSFVISVLLGYVKTFLGDKSAGIDLVPVDTVVRSMIAIARLTAIETTREMKIYNCVSARINPIIMKKMTSCTIKWAKQYPSKYSLTYPDLIVIQNAYICKLASYIFEFLPALIIDVLSKLKGSKAKMVHLYYKSQTFMKSVQFVTTRNFKYECKNFTQLCQQTKLASDHKDFDLGIDTLDWDEQLKKNVVGLRRCILREKDDNLAECKKRVNRLFWIQWIGITVLVFIVISLLSLFLVYKV